ncbi:MAG: orotate phosphoribosyltransferase [Gemmatimonadaceae bacterium]|nr:orotate phosphoribosyltransferase [Gemmatimonadaceae bacterium]
MSASSALVALLARESAKTGDFVLASGRRSSLYIDARRTTMHPEGLVLIGTLGLPIVQAWGAQSVGGLTLGADPIAYAIAYASQLAGQPVRAFTVRKEAKQHGTGQLIEGQYRAGDRVVVVEDVITTGGSALKAVAALQAAGATVAGVLAVVDREEGGREALEAAGLSVHALVRAADVLALLGS